MQFSSLFLNRSWQRPTTDDRFDEFPDGCFPSNHSMYGVCECKHAISNTLKGKKKIIRWKIGRARGPRHVSETGNEVPGKHVSKNDSFAACAVAPSCWNHTLAHEKNADHLVPPSAYLLSTTHSNEIRFPWVTLYMPRLYLTLCLFYHVPEHGSCSEIFHWMQAFGAINCFAEWRNKKYILHQWTCLLHKNMDQW